jgi:zinc/manganese transport system permease protein
MTGMFELLLWPFLASLILVGIHVYFGLHVIRRGIIFVDLSLAQVAALGMTLGILLGHDPNSDLSYLLALGAALLGAVIFTFTRNMGSKVPQEAFIGIVYAACSAASILLVSHQPEGAEHIRYMLVGSLLTVTPAAVIKTAIAYIGIGIFHWLARSQFLQLTFEPNNSLPRARLWEFLFYASFAIVVTSSVKICGVLVVFVFLVVPAVFAALITDSIIRRLMHGWLFGLVGSALGMIVSFWLDTPTGASIICVFAIMLLGAIPLVRRRLNS